jgi:hypothetical protein
VLQVGEQRLLADQPPRDDLPSDRQQLEHLLVLDRVERARPLAPYGHQPDPAQRRQVLRRAARVEPELGLQLPDGMLAVTQQFENPHPRRMPEHPKDVRLHLVDRRSILGHIF